MGTSRLIVMEGDKTGSPVRGTNGYHFNNTTTYKQVLLQVKMKLHQKHFVLSDLRVVMKNILSFECNPDSKMSSVEAFTLAASAL